MIGFMKKIINLDVAATTPIKKEVLTAMKPYWNENYGNPSSITKIGVKAKQAIEKSRKIVAEYLKARPQEIFFTSGGTESNNLAIFGLVNYLEKIGKKISDLHFITTNIEHSSILECFKELKRRGAKVDYLKVKNNGIIDIRDLRKLLKSNTVLVSIGYANSEIGTIQPIREIAKEIRHSRKDRVYPYFHVDASQAGLYCNLSTNELGVDLLTIDAQKMFGPKGIGAIFVKASINISPILFGGGQERGLRSGTENVPLIVGLAKTIELIRKDFEKKAKRIKVIRDYFWKKIKKEIPEAVLNGDLENRLPNNLNISIPLKNRKTGIDSELVVLCLDEVGIISSTKSACDYEDDGSFVVRSISGNEKLAKSSLRFTLSENISIKDIDYVCLHLKKIINKQIKFSF